MCEIAYSRFEAILSFYIPPPRQTYRWSHYVLTLSVRSSIRSFVSSNLWTWYFENKWTDFDANWHKWSMWQGHETVNFVVKVTWPLSFSRKWEARNSKLIHSRHFNYLAGKVLHCPVKKSIQIIVYINSITRLGVPGTRIRGRPRKTWSACVRNDMTIFNLDGVNPLDRNSRRTSVRRCQVLPTPESGITAAP